MISLELSGEPAVFHFIQIILPQGLPSPSLPPTGPTPNEATKLGDWTWGDPKLIRQFILEFLSPICLLHGVNMLGNILCCYELDNLKFIFKNTCNTVSAPIQALSPWCGMKDNEEQRPRSLKRTVRSSLEGIGPATNKCEMFRRNKRN